LQWLAYQGLLKYGYHELAENIRQRWVSINEKTYAATGKMMEKYNVINTELPAGGGEYPNQDGFGWTNGVFINFESAR
jgi:alpha,alpha-trehalase